jgi:hypothetical protein
MSALASQLSKGVLNEMKIRILTSNIKKEKLKLTDSSQSSESTSGTRRANKTQKRNWTKLNSTVR